MIILDTNVLSELIKQAPAEAVLDWVSVRPAASLFTTTITQAELLYGVALLPEGKRRAALREAVADMLEKDFTGRLLPFDDSAAVEYARIAAERRQDGKPISQFDAQIAAITSSRGAVLATRNRPAFEGCGIMVVSPREI